MTTADRLLLTGALFAALFTAGIVAYADKVAWLLGAVLVLATVQHWRTR